MSLPWQQYWLVTRLMTSYSDTIGCAEMMSYGISNQDKYHARFQDNNVITASTSTQTPKPPRLVDKACSVLSESLDDFPRLCPEAPAGNARTRHRKRWRAQTHAEHKLTKQRRLETVSLHSLGLSSPDTLPAPSSDTESQLLEVDSSLGLSSPDILPVPSMDINTKRYDTEYDIIKLKEPAPQRARAKRKRSKVGIKPRPSGPDSLPCPSAGNISAEITSEPQKGPDTKGSDIGGPDISAMEIGRPDIKRPTADSEKQRVDTTILDATTGDMEMLQWVNEIKNQEYRLSSEQCYYIKQHKVY